MSVGTRYTTIGRVERARTYRCVACAHTAPVTVIGVGHASADASHLLGNHDAAQARSGTNAQQNAERDVDRMLGLVRCPRCGARDPAVVRRFYWEQGTKLALTLGCVTAVVTFIFHRMDLLPFLGVWVASLAAATGIYMWVIDPKFEWTRAALCVRFQASAE